MDEPPALQWSTTFVAAVPSNTDLQGDKIILPQSALEQLLAASANSSSPSYHAPSTFTAYNSQNPYASPDDRQARAGSADSNQQLPHPLMFRLVNQANGNVVYAGIREFSGPNGMVLLSPYLMDALSISPDDLTDISASGSSSDSKSVSKEDAMSVDSYADSDNNSDVNLPSGLRITVHAHQLPKGTYVRLRPLEAGYNPDDWKPLLERQLRASYTTLTKGTFLTVRGVKGETFRFLMDKFEPEGDGICVVDTDLATDIEALNEEQARETMNQIMAKAQKAPGTKDGSSIGQEIDVWKPVDGQVLPGDYVDYELPSWARSQGLEIELSQLHDEHGVDLFVSPKSTRQRASPRDDEHVFHAFTFVESESGVKRIAIASSNAELDEAEALLISVHGYTPETSSAETDQRPRSFQLRVRSAPASNADTALPETQTNGEEHGSDEEQCKNCHQWVPKRTMILHENFCLRNNVTCPHCNNVFKKSSDDWKHHWHCPHDTAYGSSESARIKHDAVYHSERQCPSCPFVTNSIPDLARHRTSTCPGKIILCKFCHLEVPQEGDPFNPAAESILSGLSEHELADGARTTECHLCSKIVRLRDMTTHLKHHELEKAHRAKPEICRNANCGRTIHGVGKQGTVGSGTHMGQGPGNDLGLCSICFSPLYANLHDPEGKALKRRIERKYLSQMITGCGKKWCHNEWCKTGRANSGLEAKGSTVQVVLPMIKPMLETYRDARSPMFFCVDESNQKRRTLAEMLAAEKVWDLEWCIAASEAEGAHLEKAREWLMNWAPARESS